MLHIAGNTKQILTILPSKEISFLVYQCHVAIYIYEPTGHGYTWTYL